MNSAAVLDDLLDALSRCLNPESARRILNFHVNPPVQERIATLAEQANEGNLTADEHSEYEALIDAADFISILKRKAERHLDQIPH
ncbi:MAG TPA: hypothetical protein VK604_23570 [Bryobacteraceae bacterium]|nr:hypothetical protein [Bryobacteraceae bacterium]